MKKSANVVIYIFYFFINKSAVYTDVFNCRNFFHPSLGSRRLACHAYGSKPYDRFIANAMLMLSKKEKGILSDEVVLIEFTI